ncbi:MAG: cytochrome c biogenesis protein CcsA [Clostridiales bacterium]|nr:cytochrome c biogenesis protein CcsA [Clostridiales bacterium]
MRQLRVALVLLLVGGLLTTVAFVMAFTTAEMQRFGTVTLDEPVDTAFPLREVNDRGFVYERPWFSQKIFYFHVPVAQASFLVFGVAAFYSIRFLAKRRKADDTKALIAMEAAIIFVMLTMITGILWTRAAWGVWWEWEPRLTTYFIMTLMMIGYFVLRNSIEDEERRAVYAAAFGIIAFVNAPISFFITRLVPSSHPAGVFQSDFATSNLIPFLIALAGMLMLGYAIYAIRMNEVRLEERVEVLKNSLEQ